MYCVSGWLIIVDFVIVFGVCGFWCYAFGFSVLLWNVFDVTVVSVVVVMLYRCM